MARDGTVHGSDVGTFIASDDYSPYLDDVTWKRATATAARPRHRQSRVGRLPGHQSGTLTLTGLLPRLAAEGLNQAIRSGNPPFTIELGASGRGRLGVLARTNREITTPQGDKASLNSSLNVTGGIWPCDILAGFVERTYAAGALVGPIIDRQSAANARILIATLHVFAFGLGGAGAGLAVKIEHSVNADMSDPADLVTFAAAAGKAGEIKAASEVDVRQYVRASITPTGQAQEKYSLGVALHVR